MEEKSNVDEWIKKLENEFEKRGLPKPMPGNKKGHFVMIVPNNSNFAEKIRLQETNKKLIKPNVLLVYYGNEDTETINAFFHYLKKEKFENKMTGPINAPATKWVFVFLDTKKYIIGKPGVNFSKTYIGHSILISEFMIVYSLFTLTNSLDNKVVKNLIEKYKDYSVFCFNRKEDLKHRLWIYKWNIRSKIKSIINTLEQDFYYNKYNNYEEYKRKVIASLVHIHKYSKKLAEKEYENYEKLLYDEFINNKESKPVVVASMIELGF